MTVDLPTSPTPPFADRRDAGRQLARLLLHLRGRDLIVLALPRGGVPVGFEVAVALEAPLDVFATRKIGAPQQPELAVGAVAPGGVVLVDWQAVRQLGIPEEVIRAIIERESAELERQLQHFRAGKPPLEVSGKTVALVDDGLATGLTATAAVQALRLMSPASVVLAVPVGAARTVAWLREQVDELVCVLAPENFAAVGLWYANFEQTTDDEALRLLAEANKDAGDTGEAG